MMDCGKITLIFFTLCVLAGAQRFLVIRNDLEILVSVPSTHLEETRISSAAISESAGHPLKYTVLALKNKTRCINSDDPQCLSLIKSPAVDVSLTSRSSNGKRFNYSTSVNESLWLKIYIDPEVSVTPQILDSNGDNITVTLDIVYNTSNTSRGPVSTGLNAKRFILNTEFATATNQIIGIDKGQGNGQSTLGSGPLSALILLALLPVLLLK